MYSCTNSCSFVSGALEGMLIDGRGIYMYVTYNSHISLTKKIGEQVN